jgi:hypothetical protein
MAQMYPSCAVSIYNPNNNTRLFFPFNQDLDRELVLLQGLNQLVRGDCTPLASNTW